MLLYKRIADDSESSVGLFFFRGKDAPMAGATPRVENKPLVTAAPFTTSGLPRPLSAMRRGSSRRLN